MNANPLKLSKCETVPGEANAYDAYVCEMPEGVYAVYRIRKERGWYSKAPRQGRARHFDFSGALERARSCRDAVIITELRRQTEAA